MVNSLRENMSIFQLKTFEWTIPLIVNRFILRTFAQTEAFGSIFLCLGKLYISAVASPFSAFVLPVNEHLWCGLTWLEGGGWTSFPSSHLYWNRRGDTIDRNVEPLTFLLPLRLLISPVHHCNSCPFSRHMRHVCFKVG